MSCMTGMSLEADVRAGRRNIRNVFFALSLLLSGILTIFAAISARPAEADSSGCSLAVDGRPACGAKGWFRSDGEKLYANDQRRDGKGAAVKFRFLSPNGMQGDQGWIMDRSGADGVPKMIDLNIPEGWAFHYQVCLTENGVPILLTCSRTVFDTT